MGNDHEDYETGAAPAAHGPSHEDEGADEISIAGLIGETAALAAHKILPTIHQDAPGLIETHRLVAGAHHAKYTDANAVAALVAVDAIFGPDFAATSFLYATLNNTPEPKTPAQVMAILSGQAGAPFNFNAQNLTGIGTIGCGAISTTGRITTTGISPDLWIVGTAQGSISLFDTTATADSKEGRFIVNDDVFRIQTVNDARDLVTDHIAISLITGHIGIGLDDPGAFLEVTGKANVLGIIRMTQRISGAAAYGLDIGLDPTLGDIVFSKILNDVVVESFRIVRSDGSVNITSHNNGTVGLKLDGALVTEGVVDSGGAGYKLLRVPN